MEHGMTQEELDSMMGDDVDLDSVDTSDSKDVLDDKVDGITHMSEAAESAHWPPPAPTDDNRMVTQLDDVTRESELKASEIFDIIEQIGDDMMNAESRMSSALEVTAKNLEMLTKLHTNFPSIKSFETSLEETTQMKKDLESEVAMLQDNGDQIMNIMDIMQYQDIHRQKIERVINVMRALSKYMNTLFSSDKDDDSRVSSANHIHGDDNTEDVMDNEDIEALLASFGGK
jgi:hypothetical protein